MNKNDIKWLQLTPLNQIAALKLKKVGIQRAPDTLPVFDLMDWGLLNGLDANYPGIGEELLKLRFQPDQQQALTYLTEKFPGGIRTLHRHILRFKPLQSAIVLLDTLDMRLKADPHNPYPEQRK